MTTTLPLSPASGPRSPGYEELTGTYAIDPEHSRLGFVARHAMVTKVRGQFDEFEGMVRVDGADPARSTVDVQITVASIDTRLALRDEHLRSNDFLGAQQHPLITFRSTRVEQVEPARFRVTGDLTIKGTTKPVTVELEFPGAATNSDGNRRIGFEGTTTIDRRDWGVSWNAALEAGGMLADRHAARVAGAGAVGAGRDGPAAHRAVRPLGPGPPAGRRGRDAGDGGGARRPALRVRLRPGRPRRRPAVRDPRREGRGPAAVAGGPGGRPFPPCPGPALRGRPGAPPTPYWGQWALLHTLAGPGDGRAGDRLREARVDVQHVANLLAEPGVRSRTELRAPGPRVTGGPAAGSPSTRPSRPGR